MSIKTACAGCGKRYELPDSSSGSQFFCDVCGSPVAVSAAPFSPFAPPVAGGYAQPGHGGGKEMAMNRTKICAIFIMIVGFLSLLNHGSGAVLAAMGHNLNPFEPQGGNGMVNDPAVKAGQIGGSILFSVVDAISILGAWNLMKLKSRGTALAGAIICCIPLCSPCLILGIPFGIWALVLLNDAQIRPNFES